MILAHKAGLHRRLYFASGARQTRWTCHWSSGVCAADLGRPHEGARRRRRDREHRGAGGEPLHADDRDRIAQRESLADRESVVEGKSGGADGWQDLGEAEPTSPRPGSEPSAVTPLTTTDP